MVGDRAEIHRGDIDHVSVEIEEAPVHIALGIPGKIAVAMKIPAYDAVFGAVNKGAIATDRLDILDLIRMDCHRLNRFR